MLKCRLKSVSRSVCVLFCVLILHCLIIFLITPLWMPMQCKNTTKCTKILLVADPQIIGEKNEKVSAATPFTIWHSDVYLENNYNRAYDFVAPNIVIFLGDIMDEGSTATDAEFSRYYHRLRKIFPNNPSSQYIWLPGDNDVGGEGSEKVSANSLNRFYSFFKSTLHNVTHYGNTIFYEINGMTQDFPHNYFIDENNTKNETVIGLSHYTLNNLRTSFLKQIIETTQSKVFFTGHEHKAKILIRNYENHQTNLQRVVNNTIFHYTLEGNNYYEFQLPPCSYRMGTLDVGFGYVLLEENQLYFQVLWTLSGFYSVPTYVFCSLMVIFIIIILLSRIVTRQKI